MSGRVAVIKCIKAPTASRNGESTLVAALLNVSRELMSVGLMTALQIAHAKTLEKIVHIASLAHRYAAVIVVHQLDA